MRLTAKMLGKLGRAVRENGLPSRSSCEAAKETSVQTPQAARPGADGSTHTERPFIARMIHALAVPIILFWLAVVVILSVFVPIPGESSARSGRCR